MSRRYEKKTWNEINNILGNKKQNVIPNEMYSSDNKYCLRDRIANEFNVYFFPI